MKPYSCPCGPVRERGGGSLSGDSVGRINFEGVGCRRFCVMGVSLGVPLGNLERGPFTGNCER